MGDRIELKVYSKPKEERRCVQISGEANKVLTQLYRATGLPIGQIVSQMIIQGSALVDIVEVDKSEEGWE